MCHSFPSCIPVPEILLLWRGQLAGGGRCWGQPDLMGQAQKNAGSRAKGNARLASEGGGAISPFHEGSTPPQL